MGFETRARTRFRPARSSSTTASRRVILTPAERILQLQTQAGNQAVARLLARDIRTRSRPRQPVQRKTGSTPENPPVTTLQPAGTLGGAQWTAAFLAARAKPSVAAYEPLFRDIAVTAGMAALGGTFVPNPVPVSNGKTAKPGLNMTLDTSDDPGHTGWIDNTTGAFGVPLKLSRNTKPDVSVGIVLSPGALQEEKGLSLQTTRHEMVHARHKLKVLDAVRAWQTVPARRRPDFDSWLAQQAKKKSRPMSALDVALIGRGAKDGAANTEVLAYVEGFTNDFHRRPATAADTLPAFFELLGVVETRKLFTWKQADAAVQAEALTRLREYHATLDPARQRVWKDWLDRQRANLPAKDTTGRRDFFSRLSAFVI